MIISASRRTDIPAFFSDWFMNRIREQYFIRINPFNSHQRKAFSLKPEDVDVIVFWTKNPEPLIPHLPNLDAMGYRYYFQFTLNDYPPVFEPGVPSIHHRIQVFQKLSQLVGRERVVWRFDPIIYSNITPWDDLKDRFYRLAGALQGCTGRVMVSFLDLYGKVQPRLRRLESEHKVVVQDILSLSCRSELLDLAAAFASTCEASHMEVFSCSESIDLEAVGIRHGKCIDAEMVNRIFDLDLDPKKDKSQRPECLCDQAVDMGAYNTCLARCCYCYATSGKSVVEKALMKHDPTSPVLVGQWKSMNDESEFPAK